MGSVCLYIFLPFSDVKCSDAVPPLPVYQEFDRLLEEQSPIEAYIEWLDSMVDRCVVKVRQQKLYDGCLSCHEISVTELFSLDVRNLRDLNLQCLPSRHLNRYFALRGTCDLKPHFSACLSHPDLQGCNPPS